MDISNELRPRILKSITPLSKKLGYDDESLETFSIFLDSIIDIMSKANPMEWDSIGVKLENGKVILPGNFNELVNELIVDNELYSWFIPQKYGGFGYTSLFTTALSEILGYVDISFMTMIGISLTVLESLILYPNEHFNDIITNYSKGKNIGAVYFTEANAGSNLQAVKTTSELDGDEYVINGTKIFISNGGIANSGLVLARNMVNGKQEGHNVFIVENPKDVHIERLEKKSGLKASPTAQVRFDNTRVSKDAIVGDVGNGYRGVLERLMSMRIGVSMQATSATQRMYELASNYANQREQFDQKIINFPIIKNRLEMMKTQIDRMRTYSYSAAYAFDRYSRGWIPPEIGASGPVSEEQAASMFPWIVRRGLAHYYASSSKIYNSEITQHLAYDASQMFGGGAFISENEINKIMRDIRVLSIYEGTSEIHNWILSRSKQATQMIPTLKPISSMWEDKTVYEEMFYLRFPDLEGLI